MKIFLKVIDKLKKQTQYGEIAEPKPNHIFKGDIYLITVKKGTIPFRAMWNGEYFTDGFEKLEVIAWMPLPEPYKEKKHE